MRLLSRPSCPATTAATASASSANTIHLMNAIGNLQECDFTHCGAPWAIAGQPRSRHSPGNRGQ